MCSIVGGYNLDNNFQNFDEFINHSFGLMVHRGPDNSAKHKINDFIAFGHQRLSIIDLSSKSNQPKFYKDSVISYNGEIFNYNELAINHLKETTNRLSDTEVLIQLLDKFGVDILNQLNGMFAFSYYNGKEMFLIRDRFGIKPLYYTIINNTLLFASEFKSLVPQLEKLEWNIKFKEKFLRDTATDFNEETPINQIKQVPPGTYIKISKNKIEKIKWYNYKDSIYDQNYFKKKENKQIIQEFEDLLVDSIKIRLISDVPTCLTLSGGIDSSLIYTLLKERLNKEIKVFSFSHPSKKTDESEIVKKLVSHYNDNVEFIYQKEEYNTNEIIELNKTLEYPSWGLHGLAYDEVYKKIKGNGYTVVIEGHGSDEIFGGYPYMIEPIIFSKLKKFKFKSALKTFNAYKRTIDNSLQNQSQLYLILKIILKGLRSKNGRNFRENLKTSFEYKILPIVLRTFDRITMKNSIENRSPYLDYRIVEFSRNMPDSLIFNEIGTKAILRLLLKKYKKDYVFNIKRKMGFSLDMNSFVKNKENLKKLSEFSSSVKIENWQDSFDNLKEINFKIMKKIYDR